MTLYIVYRQKEYIKYFSHFISRSTLFVFIFTIIPLFVSLIVAYKTYGFYGSTSFIQVQPIVNLQQDMVLSFDTPSEVYSWSTIQYTSPNCIPTISVQEIDSNFDGIKESLNMTIKLYKPNIIAINFLLQFDYNVITPISTVNLKQPLVISANNFHSNQRLVMTGNLGVYQKRRFPSSGISGIYNKTFLSGLSDPAIIANPFDFVDGFNSDRNITIKLENVLTSWETQSFPNTAEVNIEIIYAPVRIEYHTEFWGLIKWAWVQWFYFMVIFVFCFQRFKEFVFESFTLATQKRTTATCNSKTCSKIL